MLLPGNHEYKKSPAPVAGQKIGEEQKGLSRYWRPQFTLPLNGPAGLEESAYYFDYQGVRFIMLNGNEMLEEQARWIKKVLASNPQRWTIVAIHQPFYSTGKNRDNIYHQKLFTPIFDKYGVDLVLQGHDHTYGRTHKVRRGIKQEISARGTVYVVTVVGPKQYDSGNLYEKIMAKTGTQIQFFQVISVDANQLKYEASTVTGLLYDSFVLEKK
jgi:3',5'-cyclic AMP phosphodiesterase CpdA